MKTLREAIEDNRHPGTFIPTDRIIELVKEWAIQVISTHTEHEGGYCDTGEDMDWACRSDCTRLAEKRILELSKE